jgi:hypothetical protein
MIDLGTVVLHTCYAVTLHKMIHFDPSKPTALRRACDRCHQSKLKCFRDSDNDSCQRCVRANVKCTSSPPTRPQRKTWSTTTTGITTWDSNPSQATPRNADSQLLSEPASAPRVRARGSPPSFEECTMTTTPLRGPSGSVSATENPSMTTIFDASAAGEGDSNPLRYSNGSWHTSPDSNGTADFSHLMTDFLNSHHLNPPLLSDVDAYMDVVMDQDPSRPTTSAANMVGITHHDHPHFSSDETVCGNASSPPRPFSSVHSARLSCATTLAPSSNPDTSAGSLNRDYTANGKESKGSHGSKEGERTKWLRKMSDVNINLMEHLDSVPCADSGEPDQNTANGRQHSFGIDQTLHLSQLFIDVLSNICSRLPLSNKGTDIVTPKLPPFSFSLDPAAELLIFSTYLRLIETHHRILRHVQLSITPNALPSTTRYPFQMPGLTIGSFSLSSKSDTQSLLLVNLMEAMMTQARDLIAEMSSPKHTTGYRGDFKVFGGVSLVIVPDLALKAIRSREDDLSRMFHDLKDSIRSVDYRESNR